jgi:hypothetical protein
VMLERQKILRETDSQRTPNGILRVYEHRKTSEVYLVRDPDIPLSEVESVQNEVFVLLENNGRTPEPVIPEEAAPSPEEAAEKPPIEDAPESEPLPESPPSNDVEPDENEGASEEE